MLSGVAAPLAVFELLGYVCLGLCIWHALHQGSLRRARLDELVVQYDEHGGIVWLPVVIVVTGALIVAGWGVLKMRATTRASAREALSISLIPVIVPLYFHLFFLIMLFVANIAPRLPALVGISLAMLTVSLVLHGLLLRHIWRRQGLWSPLALSHEAPRVK